MRQRIVIEAWVLGGGNPQHAGLIARQGGRRAGQAQLRRQARRTCQARRKPRDLRMRRSRRQPRKSAHQGASGDRDHAQICIRAGAAIRSDVLPRRTTRAGGRQKGVHRRAIVPI